MSQADLALPGLGACGQYSSDSDFIVALNAPQYGSGYPGPECFKQIQISANGKTATATIMDLCPGCGYGDLDMSPALFNHFADPSVGVFQVSRTAACRSMPVLTIRVDELGLCRIRPGSCSGHFRMYLGGS